MLKHEEVKLGYQLFLGREPESDEVINNICQNVHSIKQLRETFLDSAEFQQRMNEVLDTKSRVKHRHPFTLPSIPVEVKASNEQLAKMFERIHQAWEHLGVTDPYWSVVTQPHYHLDQFEDHREQFYLSGKYASDIFLAALRRNNINHNELHSCLEVGCGVGRVTSYLAKAFKKVIATDISAAHLNHAKQHFAKENIANVETQHWTDIRALCDIEPVDTIYSVITLQHNPPPVIAWMLETLLGKLKPNGAASLQIPTYRNGYLFEVERYLNTPAQNKLEMHFLPQHEIFKSIQKAGCICLEVREDGMIGDEDQMLSNTFIIHRPA